MDRESFKEKLRKLKSDAEQWVDENFDDVDDKAEDRLEKIKSWLKEKKGIAEEEARTEADRFSAVMDQIDDKLEAMADNAEEDWDAFEDDVKKRFRAFTDRFKSDADDPVA